MFTWSDATHYCEDNFGSCVDWEERYFECPECHEPIYECDWRDYATLDTCPVCKNIFQEIE